MLYYFQPSICIAVEYCTSPQIKIAPLSLKAGRPITNEVYAIATWWRHFS